MQKTPDIFSALTTPISKPIYSIANSTSQLLCLIALEINTPKTKLIFQPPKPALLLVFLSSVSVSSMLTKILEILKSILSSSWSQSTSNPLMIPVRPAFEIEKLHHFSPHDSYHSGSTYHCIPPGQVHC